MAQFAFGVEKINFAQNLIKINGNDVTFNNLKY